MEGAGSGKKRTYSSSSAVDVGLPGSSSGDDDPDDRKGKKRVSLWSHFPGKEGYPVFNPAEGVQNVEGFQFPIEGLRFKSESLMLYEAIKKRNLTGIFGQNDYPCVDRFFFRKLLGELTLNGRPLYSSTIRHLFDKLENRER